MPFVFTLKRRHVVKIVRSFIENYWELRIIKSKIVRLKIRMSWVVYIEIVLTLKSEKY